MTLPHGFGSSRCRVYDCDGFKDIHGNCDNPACMNYRKESVPLSYKFKVWKRNHSEGFNFLVSCLLAIIFITVVVFGVYNSTTVTDNLKIIIEGFNCNQLAEYVADQDKHYRYAEHRYEWLCVNEQVKEFQG